jgi:hypothetical protein
MKNKTILELLNHKYNAYYRTRYHAPTKFSVWIGYRDEFLNLSTPITVYPTTNYLTASDKEYFKGIEINWIRRRRIECLPRRKTLRFGKITFPVMTNWPILPDILPDAAMPCIQTKIFYKDFKS